MSICPPAIMKFSPTIRQLWMSLFDFSLYIQTMKCADKIAYAYTTFGLPLADGIDLAKENGFVVPLWMVDYAMLKYRGKRAKEEFVRKWGK